MMLALTLALTAGYVFPSGTKQVYDLTVSLSGYVPILGRPQSSVELKMAVASASSGADAEGNWTLSAELTELKATMGGVPLPFTVDNVRAYFPKANLVASPLGRVLKTDAPAVELPVRLPGLDSQRLPEISFLPIELPESKLEAGKTWTFKRRFSGSEMEYSARVAKIENGTATLEVKIHQKSEAFEDAGGNLVKAEGAKLRIETDLAGSGTILFDLEKGRADKTSVDSVATSKVTDLKSQEVSERVLRTKLRVALRPPAGS